MSDSQGRAEETNANAAGGLSRMIDRSLELEDEFKDRARFYRRLAKQQRKIRGLLEQAALRRSVADDLI